MEKLLVIGTEWWIISSTTSKIYLVLDSHLRQKFMQAAHDPPLAGH